MPTNKDLKRLTRSRMKKTGESYTTARSQLLEKKKTVAEEASTPRADYATRAGMSDAAVKRATGCDWERWVKSLDHHRASELPHREIARLIQETWDVSGWWAQSVAVGYERIKGLREIGQRRSGSYEANKSKTLPVPLAALYEAWSDPALRRSWLGDASLEVRKATPGKSMRWTWGGGGSVEVYFWHKGDAKSQVQIQHRKLGSKSEAEKMKAFWGERLAALVSRLEAG